MTETPTLAQRLRFMSSRGYWPLLGEDAAAAIETQAAQIAELDAQIEALRADALRYRWLRDDSVPPHNFYLSVPVEFDGVRYTRAEVDAAIDAAMAAKEPR